VYRSVLDLAYALGLADGSFAAGFEPAPAVDVAPTSCRGRSPAEFARLLWADRPGRPPAGVELNAPAWYAHGFDEGLAAGCPGRQLASASSSRSSSGT
jgi:hypothetical protein